MSHFTPGSLSIFCDNHTNKNTFKYVLSLSLLGAIRTIRRRTKRKPAELSTGPVFLAIPETKTFRSDNE